MASTKAKDNILKENNSDFNEGFLEVPFINAENTIPAPIALPAKPIVHILAPINFDAINISLFLFLNFKSKYFLSYIP